jgi:hypothetical protein
MDFPEIQSVELSKGMDFGEIRDDCHPIIHAHRFEDSSISLKPLTFGFSE